MASIHSRWTERNAVVPQDDLAKVATIPTGKLPGGIGPAGDGSRAYVGLEDDDQLFVIDMLTNAIIASVSIDQSPQAVAYVPSAVPVRTEMERLPSGEDMPGKRAAASMPEGERWSLEDWRHSASVEKAVFPEFIV